MGCTWTGTVAPGMRMPRPGIHGLGMRMPRLDIHGQKIWTTCGTDERTRYGNGLGQLLLGEGCLKDG
eukprot:186136-Chlamydomonas_euryale.AAC.9